MNEDKKEKIKKLAKESLKKWQFVIENNFRNIRYKCSFCYDLDERFDKFYEEFKKEEFVCNKCLCPRILCKYNNDGKKDLNKEIMYLYNKIIQPLSCKDMLKKGIELMIEALKILSKKGKLNKRIIKKIKEFMK